MANTSDATVGVVVNNGQGASQIERLRQPFEIYFTDSRSGVDISFVDGFQVTDRLLEVIGAFGYRVLRDGISEEADEYWVLGQLTVEVDGRTVTVEQFGGQKIHRAAATCVVEKNGQPCGGKANDHRGWNNNPPRIQGHQFSAGEKGPPLAIADDMKGAATDAFKKCCSLLGVGLYLSRKDGTATPGRPVAATRGGARTSQPAQPAQAPQRPQPAANGAQPKPPAQGAARCQETEGLSDGRKVCGDLLASKEFQNGVTWSAGELANKGKSEYGMVLCWPHMSRRRFAAQENTPAQGTGQKAATG